MTTNETTTRIQQLARAIRSGALGTEAYAAFTGELLAIFRNADHGDGLDATADRCGISRGQLGLLRRLLGLPGGATLSISWEPSLAPNCPPSLLRKSGRVIG